MEQFNDNQRYSLEKAQIEAQTLKAIVENPVLNYSTYGQAEYCLPDTMIRLGLSKEEAEMAGLDFEDPMCPIIDSDDARNDGPSPGCGEFNRIECDHCEIEINSDECKKCGIRWLL
jgi:hypothetical protein